MKKILYILVLLPMVLTGQTITQNYVKTKTYKTATATSIATPSLVQAKENITYFDGLGRPIQQLAKGQSATGKNIVTHIEYDAFGRQVKEYLPYCKWYGTPNLDYTNVALSETMAYYSTNDPSVTGNPAFEQTLNPFSEKELEASRLNRVLKQGAPGNDWAMGQGHEVKFDYLTNSANEVKLFLATSNFTSNTITLFNDTGTVFYPAGELYKTITKDENWVSGKNNTTEEFKNKDGQVILKRTYCDYRNGRVTTREVPHNTYYVYDSYGNLTFVLPPKADAAITPSVLSALCYQYKYDYRNRLIEKKLPGKEWEFMVYDKLDRVVATGPALSPFTDFTAPDNVGWFITKYDAFNRTVLTGWLKSSSVDSSGRAALQSLYNSASLPVNESRSATDQINGAGSFMAGYTNTTIPSSFATAYHALTVSYYDDYTANLTFTPGISFTIPSMTPQPVYYNNTAGTKPKGLPTVSWIRVPQTSSLFNAEKNYVLYDEKERPVRNFLNNHHGGFTQTDTQMEAITGRVNYTITTHSRNTAAAQITTRDDFSYSQQDRLITHAHTINGGTPQLLAENTYDELGQLISKKVGNNSNSPLQKVDYKYNIRGWMKGINDAPNPLTGRLSLNAAENDLFSFRINYNKVDDNGNVGNQLYNGNIAETYWRTSEDNVLRQYLYTYDAMNRLRDATYMKPEANSQIQRCYDEGMSYDKNGNILTLYRFGEYDDPLYPLIIDDLVYSYDSSNSTNRLMRVTDSSNNPAGFRDDSDGTNDTADDYDYDALGNMTKDDNKKITSIKYNHLNLPVEIYFDSGNAGVITYLYNAVGEKIQKKVLFPSGGPGTLITDYLNGFQYFNEVLNFFPTSEGYVQNTVVGGINNYNYVFNYKDHLGNIRLSYGKDPQSGNLKIMEENHYYPFGLKHTNYNGSLNQFEEEDESVVLAQKAPPGGGEPVNIGPYRLNKYKYNGKEYQDELGLNMYDYGARNYDPALGRWMNIDPKAETSRRWSPYTYAMNNPVFYIDPDGMQADDNFYFNRNGDLTRRAKTDAPDRFFVEKAGTSKPPTAVTPVSSSLAGTTNISQSPKYDEVKLSSDLGAMAKTVYAEAGGQSKEAKVALAEVIRNRAEDTTTPAASNNYNAQFSGVSTNQEVVSQPSQFQSVGNNVANYANPLSVTGGNGIGPRNEIETTALSDSVGASIKATMQNTDTAQGATYFYSPYISPPKWTESMEQVTVPGVSSGDFRFYKY